MLIVVKSSLLYCDGDERLCGIIFLVASACGGIVQLVGNGPFISKTPFLIVADCLDIVVCLRGQRVTSFLSCRWKSAYSSFHCPHRLIHRLSGDVHTCV